MKSFVFAFVVCVLYTNAQAGILPVPISSLPIVYSTGYGPGLTIGNTYPIVYKAPSTLPDGTHLISPPLVVPVALKPEATYIAKTPGSEHIASLPGHFISTSSINLDQAPGIDKVDVKDSSSLAPSVAIHGSVIASGLPITYSSFVVPVPIVLPTEATYVAKNLGVEHVAPLPGHITSAASLNLEPAPVSK